MAISLFIVNHLTSEPLRPRLHSYSKMMRHPQQSRQNCELVPGGFVFSLSSERWVMEIVRPYPVQTPGQVRILWSVASFCKMAPLALASFCKICQRSQQASWLRLSILMKSTQRTEYEVLLNRWLRFVKSHPNHERTPMRKS
jgi:hypothetical protein